MAKGRPTVTGRREFENMAESSVRWYYEEPTGPNDDPRSVGKVRVGDLIVDQRVQRPVDPLKVEKIRENLDWALLEGISVVQRSDGALVVIEGQNRTEALKSKNPNIKTWVLRLTDVSGLPDEAATALGIAKGRTPHNRVQEWRMRVTAGLEHEVAAEHVLDELGLAVTEGRGVHSISAAGTLMRIIHGTGSKQLSPQAGAELLRKTLSAILVSIPEEGASAGRRFDSAILRAVATLIAEFPQLSLQRLTEKLSERTATQWLAFRQNSSPTWKGVYNVLMSDYNRAMRTKRLS